MTCTNAIIRIMLYHFKRTMHGGLFWLCLIGAWALYYFTCPGSGGNMVINATAEWDYSDTLVFFVTAPWIPRFASDMKNRTSVYLSVRCGIRNYIKATALALMTGVLLSSLLCHAGLLLIAWSRINMNHGVDMEYLQLTFLGHLLKDNHTALYLMAQVIRRTVVCLFFGAAGLWTGTKVGNVMIMYVLPMALYQLLMYLFLLFPSLPQYYAPDLLIAQNILLFAGEWTGIWVVFGYTVPGIAVFLLLFCRDGEECVYNA